MKCCFLILNYKTFDEVVNCINSIEKIFEGGGKINFILL